MGRHLCQSLFFNKVAGLRPNFFIVKYWQNHVNLKVKSCKLSNNKYMITSTQIRNPEIFVFMAVLVFKFLGRKVLFINRNDNRNC